MSERRGHRGYIASRPILGNRVPQAVQNLVIRDYAQRRGLVYLISATEYAMPNCYMMLEAVMQELPRLAGMIAYSLFMLPAEAAPRREIYRRVLDAGGNLHAALESQILSSPADIGRIEDLFLIQQALAATSPAI